MFSFTLLVTVLCSGPVLLGSVPAVEDPYEAAVRALSPERSVRALFKALQARVQCGGVPCGKCDLAGAVHQLIGDGSAPALQEDGRSFTVSRSQFPALAAGGVLFLSSPDLVCTAVKEGRWAEESERFLHRYTHHDHDTDHAHHDISIHALQDLLQELQGHYEPSENQNCASAASFMPDAAVAPEQQQEVGVVLGRVLVHALQGRCFSAHFLPEESFFLDSIMDRVGSENLTVEGLEAVMMMLNIGPGEDHEHALRTNDHHHHHEEQRGRSKRSTGRHEDNSTWEQRCFSAEELLQIHGLSGSAHSGMGRPEVVRLSPALIQQILSGACAPESEPETQDGLTEAERYLYGTLANVVITLMSMFGIVLLLCTSCTNVFQLCIQFCISMAVGSLTGDALLHLVPMFLGLHVHSDEDSSHGGSDHNHEEGIPDYTFKMLAMLGGIYLFYLMESLFSLMTQENHQHAEDSDPHHCDHGRVLEMFQQERKQKDRKQSTSKTDLVEMEKQKSESDLSDHKRDTQMLPYMITIGDGIHNFADGLAVGAAFSLSWKSGLATSVAVLCHELPHEVGDFAILLYSGMSVPRALLLNLFSAMISFVGLYIALSVATDFATTQWITAVAGGLFLYVGLADMLPTLVHTRSRRPWLTFGLQNLGLLTGWSVLLLLSLYEDKIHF
ncbi:zinc transporter ZIP4 [Oryzias melastigma]|uniref:zinc transporter ZIP4 n=1 Tax=Oryzias melastigma TaxID=30732 RepID=UPI000CF7D87E|nr:zinc transporter ZIP4 [Oryzias melastigma]